jgi:hypothetical protein
VTAGVTKTSNNDDFAPACDNPDGTLDTTFSMGGQVTNDFAGGDDSAFAVDLQADGTIVAAGGMQPPDRCWSVRAERGVRPRPLSRLAQHFGRDRIRHAGQRRGSRQEPRAGAPAGRRCPTVAGPGSTRRDTDSRRGSPSMEGERL